MKSLAMIILGVGFTLFKNWVFPNLDLTVVMTLALVLDFITGVIKSVALKIAITSWGFRKTIIKFLQYGGAILIGIFLSSVMAYKGLGTELGLPKYIVDVLVVFIIYIELVSILENLTQMDNKSPIATKILKPLHKLLTFQLNNNPIKKLYDSREKPEPQDNKPEGE